jgi:hypothetical protein
LLVSRPLWPVLSLLVHDEGDPLSHMLICIVGHARLLLLYLMMTMMAL